MSAYSNAAAAIACTAQEPSEEQLAELFRAGMAKLGGACTIITSSFQGECAGLTATAVCSVSTTPPRLLVCVNRKTHAHEIIQRSKILNVNVLAPEHEALARRFAGMTHGVNGEDKFLEGDWAAGKVGAPALPNTLVTFECEVESVSTHGTHSVFFCDVKHVHTLAESTTPQAALLYFNRNFHHLAG